MAGNARGGDDSFAYSGFGNIRAYGDALTITGTAQGGKDTIKISTSGEAIGFGDADIISGHGRGGNDTVDVGSGQRDGLWRCPPHDGVGPRRQRQGRPVSSKSAVPPGPSATRYEMSDHTVGGNDIMTLAPTAIPPLLSSTATRAR